MVDVPLPVSVVIRRPALYIQSDWDEALRHENGKIWIMCKTNIEDNRGTIYGEAAKTARSENSIQTSNNGFRAELGHQRCIRVSYDDPNSDCVFFAPTISFAKIHDKSVVSLDVCSGGLGVSACSASSLKVWDTETGEVRRVLQGHIWDVYRCRFFPSGIVILSGGADMHLKIWSAETGQCAATLTGHSAAITDMAIVERGRNIVSTSKDGTSRLWDCGQQKCLKVLSRDKTQINCCVLLPWKEIGETCSSSSDREIGTEGKLLVIGCEGGTVSGIGLRSSENIFEYHNSSAVNCCCSATSDSKLVYGLQDGSLYLCDIENPSMPQLRWDESTSPVLCLQSYQQGFFAARADGTCTYYEPNSSLTIQLTGPDCDPVYGIAFDGTYVYTACRDSQIRKYSVTLPNIK